MSTHSIRSRTYEEKYSYDWVGGSAVPGAMSMKFTFRT